MSQQGAAPPGWYADPAGAWQYRYWDGAGWTGDTAPMGTSLASGGAGGAKIVPPLPFPAVRAEFGRRAIGYLIDWLVLVIPLVVVIVAVVFLLVAASSGSDNGPPPGLFLVLLPMYALVFALPLLYNGWLQSGGRRTVGQRVNGLRTVDARTGQPLSFGKAVLRALVAGIASGQLLGLGYWWALIDNEQRTWHDMAVSSAVIDSRAGDPATGR